MIADALCDGSTCDLLLHRGSLSWQHERSGLHTYLPIRCAALHTNHACGTVKYPFDLTRTDSGKGYNLVVKLGPNRGTERGCMIHGRSDAHVGTRQG